MLLVNVAINEQCTTITNIKEKSTLLFNVAVKQEHTTVIESKEKKSAAVVYCGN